MQKEWFLKESLTEAIRNMEPEATIPDDSHPYCATSHTSHSGHLCACVFVRVNVPRRVVWLR